MTPAEYAEEGQRLTRLLDAGIQTLREQVTVAAQAENAYRKARASAWVRSRADNPKATVAEREAWVDGETADLRMERDIADGMKRAAIEAIRARQEQLGLLRTLIASQRAEMELAR